MIPSPGRIVAYTITEQDAHQINKRRQDAVAARQGRMGDTGEQHHVGNSVSSGEVYPMVIVRVWSPTEDPGTVNGQVLLDGNDTLWVTSAAQGAGPRQWHEFPRV